jgi:amino acid adenylation domain-containing protein
MAQFGTTEEARLTASITSPLPRPLGVPAVWTGAGPGTAYAASRLEQLVARQAARTPEAPALQSDSTVVSYAALMGQARRVAGLLRRRGVRRDDLVAVCIDRSIEQIVAVLGILLAGAAYVPIDPQGPLQRRRFMLDDAQPRAIVTCAAFAESIPAGHRALALTCELAGDSAAAEFSDAPLPDVGTPQDLAYVIYTSGSTGTPKGVLNQHDGASNHVAWMAEAFPLSARDRVLGKTPAVFDVSVWEWFWPLSQGACLVLTRPGGEKDPPYLIEAIESHGITNIQFVPTLLRLFLEREDLDRCRSLQRVICSGEALTAELRDQFFDRMPGPPALINLYGPTETAVHVTGWICAPGETGPVPIGRPLPNVRTYIVDEALNPVPAGERGELLIGGVQVARGYLRRPELTAERFVPDPFEGSPTARCYRTGDCVSWRPDGVIDFFGRYDAQVQLGGVRVEPGEIEAALRQHPAVADAAVLVRETEASKRLVAYLRRARPGGSDSDPSVDSLRRALADTLADYMTPGWFVWLDEFPVTPTGKLDRRALPPPEAARPRIERAFEAPHAGTETRLARIWCDVLQIDRVGRHDDFHLLGADSLSAVRVIEAIGNAFGITVPLGELVRSPTVARLASVIDGGRGQAQASSIVTLQAGAGREALYLPPLMGGGLQHWRDLVQALGPGRPVYGFALPTGVEATTDVPRLAASLVGDLIAFQPEGPYHLAGYSFSAAVALEMAQQLRASGRTVGVLAMVDFGPGLPASPFRRIRTTAYLIRNLPYWLRYDILQEGPAALRARIRRKLATFGQGILRPRPSDARGSAERAVDEMFDRGQLPEAHRRLLIENLTAFYRYDPQAYAGAILLFWARCRPFSHSNAPRLGWEFYAAGPFERIVVECTHDNILKMPHVAVVAAGIEAAIRGWATPALRATREAAQLEPEAAGDIPPVESGFPRE